MLMRVQYAVPFPRALLVLTLLGAAMATRSVSAADDNKPAAQQHFDRARSLYSAGRYREALAELEQARSLDPEAKDLVLNLAIVSEKLARFDDALRYMRMYQGMPLEPQERVRADTTIRRLEGAKREVDEQASRATTAADEPKTQPSDFLSLNAERPVGARVRMRGRLDGVVVGLGAVALVGLGVGTFFGIKALSDKPSSPAITDGTRSYASLQAQADKAHNESIVADVAFGVFALAGAGAAILYFARERVPAARPSAAFLLGPRGAGVRVPF